MSEHDKSLEEKIRDRAYALWEQDGRPDGRSEEYWDLAKQELEGPESADDLSV